MTTYYKIKGSKGKGHIWLDKEIDIVISACRQKAVYDYDYLAYRHELTPTTTNLCKRCQNWEKGNG